MRKAALYIAAVAVLAGCHGSDDSKKKLQDGVVMQLDKTRLLFGQQFGDATLLGTRPVDTLEIFNNGKDDLTIGKVEIVSGNDSDGGALNDTSVFTTEGASVSTLHGGDTGFVQVTFSPTHKGLFGAILRISSNANPATTDVVLSGDCVTPEVAILSGDGGTDITVPDWQLVPYADGGGFVTGYSFADVLFVNSGTAQLHFKPADFGDAGNDTWELCTPKEGTSGCQTGPLPNSLERSYPDGGLAISVTDAGYIRNAALLRIGFTPTAPGTFTQHVFVTSDATNQPVIDLTVHGTATTP